MAARATREEPWTQSEWVEIQGLRQTIRDEFYERDNSQGCLDDCRRLEALLKQVARRHDNILGEECWALVSEVKGDLEKVILHRLNEIELIKRLRRKSAKTPARADVLRENGPADLSDRMDLLAGLNHDAGYLDLAIRALTDSRRLCRAHGLTFEGEDMLRDYRSERRTLSHSHEPSASGRSRRSEDGFGRR